MKHTKLLVGIILAVILSTSVYAACGDCDPDGPIMSIISGDTEFNAVTFGLGLIAVLAGLVVIRRKRQ